MPETVVKRAARAIAVMLFVATLAIVARLRPDIALQVGAGYAARVVCALHFHSGLDPERVMRDYVAYDLGPAAPLVRVAVDGQARAVDASSAWLGRARAIHREGVGGTLVADANEAELLRFRAPPRAPPLRADLPWPRG